MWGYSFEELARRAQEEAARLAEQASSIQSPGFLNLDSMNPDSSSAAPPHNNNDNNINNYALSANNASSSNDAFSTPQAKNTTASYGGSDLFSNSSLLPSSPSPTVVATTTTTPPPTTTATTTTKSSKTPPKVHTTPIVTKLPSAADESDDDFNFDSWGEEDDNIIIDDDDGNAGGDGNGVDSMNNTSTTPTTNANDAITQDSDEMAERMREESRKLAQQIITSQEQEQLELQQQQLELQQQQEQYQQQEQGQQQELHMDPADLEAEQLREQSRLVAEAIMKEEDKQKNEVKKNDIVDIDNNGDAKETTGEKVEKRLAEDQCIQDEAEETARDAEHKRFEEEKRLAEEARIAEEQRIQEAKKAAAEAERLRLEEEERLSEEARIAEEQRIQEEEEKAEAEAERLRLEEEERLAEEARIAEEQRIQEEEEKAAAEAERLRLEEEKRLAEEARIAEEQRIQEEKEAAAEAERLRLEEEERLSEEARIAEEQRIIEEEEKAEAEAERLRLEEEERLAEKARIAEKQLIRDEVAVAEAELLRLKEEERLAEETRIAEEQVIEKEEEASRVAERLRLEEEERLAEELLLSEEQRVIEEREEQTMIAEEETEYQQLEKERVAVGATATEEIEASPSVRKSSSKEEAIEGDLIAAAVSNEIEVQEIDGSGTSDSAIRFLSTESEDTSKLMQSTEVPLTTYDSCQANAAEMDTVAQEKVSEDSPDGIYCSGSGGNGWEDDFFADENLEEEPNCSRDDYKVKNGSGETAQDHMRNGEDTPVDSSVVPSDEQHQMEIQHPAGNVEDTGLEKSAKKVSESKCLETNATSQGEPNGIQDTGTGPGNDLLPSGDTAKATNISSGPDHVSGEGAQIVIEQEESQSSDEKSIVEEPLAPAEVDAQKSAVTPVTAGDATATQSSTPSLQSLFGSHASQLFEASNAASTMFSWGFNANASSKTESESSPMTNEPPASKTNISGAVMTGTDGADADSMKERDEGLVGDEMDDLYNDNELDDMYDDDDDETDEEGEATTKSVGSDCESKQHLGTREFGENQKQSLSDSVPQDVLENFMKQLERMTESHQLEISELQRVHRNEVDILQRELLEERESKKAAKARAEVASQDKHLAQMRELEKKFNATLKEKADELEEVMKRNEGMALKMDSMKREVEGLAKIVDERDDEICRLKQGHGNTMMQVEGKVKVGQEEVARKDAEIMDLKSTLSSMKADLDTTSEAYSTLKTRAKTIATELKDRRVEVRTLTSQNEELNSSKTTLETQVKNLQSLVNQHELTISYKDKDMEVLNEKMKELSKQLEGKDKSLQDRSAVGEKAIASYKRKAQEALAAANARLASANQAREEAESDAKSAKLAADEAVERARTAEARRSEAEKSLSELGSKFEADRSAMSQEITDLKTSVEKLNVTIESMQDEAEEAHAAREKVIKELDELGTKLAEEKEKSAELREKLIEEKTMCDSLQREVHDLHDEVQRSSAAAFKRARNEGENINPENHFVQGSTQTMMPADGNIKFGDRSEADGTIIMLQQELQGANDAIMELKLALRTALLERADRDDSNSPGFSNKETSAPQYDEGMTGGSGNNDNTPLFFAIEKQNELNTAREEINRLATMLGDAESEKQEAFDAMEEMRQKMEEANARLLRYEKLGMQSGRPQHANGTASSYGPFRSMGSGSSFNSVPRASGADDRARVHPASGHDSVVNLEYLKNVMLSYLKAKTLAERRKLVPVIGTVLCLTPEEQAQAVHSVEQSAGLGGVASSFWENLESKAHNLM